MSVIHAICRGCGLVSFRPPDLSEYNAQSAVRYSERIVELERRIQTLEALLRAATEQKRPKWSVSWLRGVSR